MKFTSKVNMTCVSPTGEIDKSKFAPFMSWSPKMTMEGVLTELRREMAAPHNRKLPQPPEGSCYA